MNEQVINVGFVGNPNCGKTSLFNELTGSNLKVANWPGVTVEKKEGQATYKKHNFRMIDLPGIYSLTSYTMEEVVTREAILTEEIDIIVNVVDASSLERNLYLTLQLIELGKPVILALNMMDIVEERGMEIDLHRLPEMLGIPAIPVSARRRSGLQVLLHAIAHHKDNTKQSPLIHHHLDPGHHIHRHHDEYAMVYSCEIEDKIDLIIAELHKSITHLSNERWYAIKLLEQDQEVMKKYPIDLPQILDRSYELDIINEKYNFIEEIMAEVLVDRTKREAKTERVDRFLTHRYLGIPIFLLIMGVVFFLTFVIGDWLKSYFEVAIDAIASFATYGLHSLHMNDWITSLLVDGIIAGVGGILTFLPNIFILFLALAILEDSGYMSRVAFVMDGLMSRMGLSGRAFVPMLVGFGCTVPAIMATRTLENPKDRFKAILITPFMSCSAKLPIYVLFASMFFRERAMLVCYFMYVLGLLLGILTAYIYSKIDRSKAENNLLIELPEYKTPNVRTIGRDVWDKVKHYLTRAGTVIFIASILLWFVLHIGVDGFVSDISDSLAAMIGRVAEPIFRPVGLGYWQIIVALIAGLAAKEVVVSSSAVIFSITNIASTQGMLDFSSVLSQMGFTAVNAIAMMVFCLLYVPCVATIGVIQSELKSLKLTGWIVFFQLSIAWVMSFIAYHVVGFFLH